MPRRPGYDDNGHGGNVAGIVGALDDGIGIVGVAPGARLWAVKVLDANGSGSLAGITAGIDWVAGHAAGDRSAVPGGRLWTTVGQGVRGADLAVRINDLSFAVGGQRPAIHFDPDAAGAELGRLLEGRGPLLLIVDDVWEAARLRPFRFGGPGCTRLVITPQRGCAARLAPGRHDPLHRRRRRRLPTQLRATAPPTTRDAISSHS